MKLLVKWTAWFAAMCLALSLLQPGLVVADDDDDWDEPDTEVSDDDDDWGDDDGSGDDDDDWSQPAPPVNTDDDGSSSQPAPAQPASDDDDDTGDDDDDWGDDDGGNATQPVSPPATQPADDDCIDDDDDGSDDGSRDDDDLDDSGDDDRDDDGSDDDSSSSGNDDDDDTSASDDDDDDRCEDDGLDRPVPDQAIVQLRPGVDANAFAQRNGATVDRVIPTSNIVLLQLNPAEDDQLELDDLMTDDDVLWSEFNYTNQAPEGRPRYFFTSTAATSGPADGPALPEGLEYTPESSCVTGADVVVAVLDTGVDVTHPDLATRVLPNGLNTLDNTYEIADDGDGVDDDGDGQVDELVGHGTHVAGIVVQVAPESRILPVKVLNSDGVGNSFSVISGIHYAVEQGADVINLSLGSTYDSVSIREAVTFAHEQGVVVVAAAGNANQHLPAEFPAAVDTVISVASTNAGADKAEYSNWHETVDLSAPGDNVASAYPGGVYTSASGTSMSAPIVAGTAALLLERQPGVSPGTVLSVMSSTAGPLTLTDPTLEGMMGSGEVNIDASLSCNG